MIVVLALGFESLVRREEECTDQHDIGKNKDRADNVDIRPSVFFSTIGSASVHVLPGKYGRQGKEPELVQDVDGKVRRYEYQDEDLQDGHLFLRGL